jgi:hypothetical protein
VIEQGTELGRSFLAEDVFEELWLGETYRAFEATSLDDHFPIVENVDDDLLHECSCTAMTWVILPGYMGERGRKLVNLIANAGTSETVNLIAKMAIAMTIRMRVISLIQWGLSLSGRVSFASRIDLLEVGGSKRRAA